VTYERRNNGWPFAHFTKFISNTKKFYQQVSADSASKGTKGMLMRLVVFRGVSESETVWRIAMIGFASDSPIFQILVEFEAHWKHQQFDFPFIATPLCMRFVTSNLPEARGSFPATRGSFVCWHSNDWAEDVLTCSGLHPKQAQWYVQELDFQFPCLTNNIYEFAALEVSTARHVAKLRCPYRHVRRSIVLLSRSFSHDSVRGRFVRFRDLG
jgi:hypothetical protein